MISSWLNTKNFDKIPNYFKVTNQEDPSCIISTTAASSSSLRRLYDLSGLISELKRYFFALSTEALAANKLS